MSLDDKKKKEILLEEKRKKRQEISFEKAKTKRKMILSGSVVQTIFAVCLPLFFYNLFNSFYGLVDSIMVASINSSAVSAVSSLNQLKTLIESVITGVGAGGAIIVSRRYGAGDLKEARKNANVLVTLGLTISFLLIVICVPFAVPIMELANVPDSSITIGVGYFRVQMLMLALIAINTIYIGLEKAKGNTKLIFALNIIVMITKLFFTFLFVKVLNIQDVTWVAFATFIAQLVLFVIAIYILTSKNNVLRVRIRELGLKWSYVYPILIISLPIFLGKFVFSLGKVVVNGMCKIYGDLTVGALGVSNSICGIITSPTNSFEEGESTMISQNLGNRNISRAMKIFKKTLLISSLIGLFGYILVRFIIQDQLIMLFNTGNNLEEAEQFVKMIEEIFKYDSLSIPALAVNAAVLGVLYGFGKTGLSMIINISRVFVFRVPILWYFKTFKPELGSKAAGISMGISNICIMIMSIVVLIIFLISIKKNGYKGMHFGDPEPDVSELIIN